MHDLLLKIITFLHFIFVLFVVVIPFTNSTYFLFLHAIFIPFMILHWICNDNTCVLTIIERQLRKYTTGKASDDDCITCRLIEPVWDFRKNYEGFTAFIYIVTILLWLISVIKLICKYRSGEIKNIKDLFVI